MKRMLSLLATLLVCSSAIYAYTSPYNKLGSALNKPYKVTGGAGIVQFAKAFGNVLPMEMENADIDRKGGYISYGEEGDGHYNVNMCIWNRKDGKKLFVVSYDISETITGDAAAGTCSKYHYSAVCDNKDGSAKRLYNIGFRSYLYNVKTATLEPMAQFPVDELPRTGAAHEAYFLALPDKGKDIVLQMGIDENVSFHNLVWNGMGWNLVQTVGAAVYVTDNNPPTNVRNAPNGTIVATLNDDDMICVDRCVNGWMHIMGNDYQRNDGEPAVFKTTGDKWIHHSKLTSNWAGSYEKVLYSSPSTDSAVVARIKNINDDNEIKGILDMKNEMVKVRTVNGLEGWVEAHMLCGNSLTTCP